MERRIFLSAFCLIALNIGCGGNGGQEAPALPTGIATLSLGDTFDSEGEHVHVFSDEAGELSYVYNDGGAAGPINVALDDEGRIIRLTWEQQVHSDERMQEVMREAERRFGAFLKDKMTDDEETRMYFEDGATAYTLTFIGHTITLTTEPLTMENTR